MTSTAAFRRTPNTCNHHQTAVVITPNMNEEQREKQKKLVAARKHNFQSSSINQRKRWYIQSGKLLCDEKPASVQQNQLPEDSPTKIDPNKYNQVKRIASIERPPKTGFPRPQKRPRYRVYPRGPELRSPEWSIRDSAEYPRSPELRSPELRNPE